MKKLLFILIPLFAVTFGGFACDDSKTHKDGHYEKHEVKKEDGTVIKEEKKVTENEEGDKTVTETHEVDRP